MEFVEAKKQEYAEIHFQKEEKQGTKGEIHIFLTTSNHTQNYGTGSRRKYNRNRSG